MKILNYLLAIFFLVLGLNAVFAQTDKSQMTTNVLVVQPANGARVQHICPVIGKVKKFNTKTIYRIVVIPFSLMNYHPQSGTVLFEKDGNFKGTAFIGAAGGSYGEKFDILIVETNQAGSDQFDSYIRQVAKTGNWTGLASLPENTIEIARIKGVVRE